jgi:glycosyltransferase involved in cell wall biosynthesis
MCCDWEKEYTSMRVLLVHNFYRTSAPSGEDVAVGNERRMLEKRGVEVVAFERANDDLYDSSVIAKAANAVNAIWSQRSRSELSKLLRKARPDLVHVHNTFAMLSPSVYGACKAEGVPVVQTLHNFRFFCPAALLLRDGKPCEDCLEKGLTQSLKHRCYRGSLSATATIATMLTLHRLIGTYDRDIQRYIILTRFGRSKAIKGGIAEGKIVVKPNFLPDPPAPGHGRGGYAIYVGRLLEGKGVETLIAAWRYLPHVRLKILGDGALRSKLEAMAELEDLNVEFLGRRDRPEVLQAIADARLLVIPSECYEGFPMVIAEAFACGTPVLASRIGSMEELIEEGVTGRKFIAGDPSDLARQLQTMLNDEPALDRMRVNVRRFFDAYLTEDQNFAQLMGIYSEVLAREANAGQAQANCAMD